MGKDRFDVFVEKIEVVEKVNNLVIVKCEYDVLSSKNKVIMYRLGKDVGIIEGLSKEFYDVNDNSIMDLVNDRVYSIVEKLIREL